MSRRWRRAVRWIAVAIPLVVTAVGGVAVWWVLSTESGAAWTLDRVRPFLPAGTEFQTVSGRIRGPLLLRGVRAATPAAEVTVEQLRLAWRMSALLGRRVHVEDITVQGIHVRLTEVEEAAVEPTAPTPLPSLEFPVAVRVDRLQLRHLEVQRGDSLVNALALDSVLLAARISRRGRIDVTPLTLAGPSMDARATLRLEARGDYEVLLDLSYRFALPDQPVVEGRGSVRGAVEDGVEVEIDLSSPARMTLSAEVMAPRVEPRLRATLVLPPQEIPELEARTGSRLRLGADLELEGTAQDLDVRGTLETETEPIGAMRADLDVRYEPEAVTIRRVVLTTPGGEIRAQVGGRIELTGEAPSGDVSVEWERLRWPLAAGPVAVASRTGRLRVIGGLDQYTLEGEADVTVPDRPRVRVGLAASGTRERLRLSPVRVGGDFGRLEARGTVRWTPVPAWALDVRLRELEASALLPEPDEWRGQLDLSGRIEGRKVGSRIEGRLDVPELVGTLRGDALASSLAGSFTVYSDSVVSSVTVRDGAFDLRWGDLGITAAGELGDEWNLDWTIDAPDLSTPLPDVRGSVRSEGTLVGPRGRPRGRGQLVAESVAYGETQVGHAALTAVGDLASSEGLSVEVRARDILAGGQSVDSLTLDVQGTPDAHRVAAAVFAQSGGGSAEVEGMLLDPTGWTGMLRRLEARWSGLGSWILEETVPVEVGPEGGRVDPACLRSDLGRTCVQGAWQADGSVRAGATVEGLDVGGALASRVPEGWTVTGKIDAEVSAQVGADGTLGADVFLGAGPGRVTVRGKEREDTLVYRNVRLTGTAGDGGLAAELTAEATTPAGLTLATTRAQVAVPDFRTLSDSFPALALSGELTLEIGDLSHFTEFAPSADVLEGRLETDVEVGGTIGRPNILGSMTLANGAATLTDLGLRLEEVGLRVQGEEGSKLSINGRLESGEGTLELEGTSDLDPEAELETRLQIRGRRVQAMNTPEIRVWLSPDLDVRYAADGVDVRGRVTVERADIELAQVPETAVRPSRDVVFVGDTAAGRRAVPVRADLGVSLGDSLSFSGLGFTARPRGELAILQEPAQPARATGEVDLTGGRYRAYGQDLTVDRGRVLFAAGPVTDPALDIRASRTARDGVVAGVNVAGTLRAPEVTLFSEPPMSESDALSYVVLGRPLSGASSGEASQVSRAATSLGLRGGNLLASAIASRYGLDELRVETEGSFDEASLVAGKYLSPRLYVSYGIGLLQPSSLLRVRYLLTSKWTLEAQSGNVSGADLFYRIERGR